MIKRYYLLLLVACACAMIHAAETNPVRDYLDNPGTDTFSTAVQYLTLQDKDSSGSMQAKLNLAYIANYEAQRLMDLALSQEKELKPAERFSLANMFLALDRYNEAIKLYEVLNKESPKWSCPWRHKGEALYKSGDYPASAQALEMAIETNEEHYDAYIWYAMALYKLERYQDAKTALDTALYLNSDEESSLFDEEIPDDQLQQMYKDLQEKLKK
ncbi:MAG TPA: tetratricopeptide repeat protein [Candidatus Cloacimonadota bacterium]|nr:tetratricopeptide repeat protein [Candidatus Cloacimonadota bacterium]